MAWVFSACSGLAPDLTQNQESSDNTHANQEPPPSTGNANPGDGVVVSSGTVNPSGQGTQEAHGGRDPHPVFNLKSSPKNDEPDGADQAPGSPGSNEKSDQE
jgi:hypothetical protein